MQPASSVPAPRLTGSRSSADRERVFADDGAGLKASLDDADAAGSGCVSVEGLEQVNTFGVTRAAAHCVGPAAAEPALLLLLQRPCSSAACVPQALSAQGIPIIKHLVISLFRHLRQPPASGAAEGAQLPISELLRALGLA